MDADTTRLPTPSAGAAAPGDAELLRAFQGGTDGAFAEIVGRHGRMVLAVCRSILGGGPDADDAFQATFIVLARGPERVRRPEALAGWLYGVAARVSRRARVRRARSWAREATTMTADASSPAVPSDADPAAAAVDRDTRAAVWAELGELPDQYRDPLVLCYFEDRTTEQAAAALRCPVGTLRSRLVKARELLRSRLVRRGLTLSAVAAVAVLTEGRAAAAEPPPELARQTAAAAKSPTADPAVSQLVEGVMREMTKSWWPAVVVAGLLGVAVVLIGLAAGSTATGSGGQPPAPKPAGPGTLLVVSQRDATLVLIDPATSKTRATVKTDPCPHEVAVSTDGKTAAVANYGLPFGKKHGGTVTIVDVATGKFVRTIDVGVESGPHGLHWLDDNRLLCTIERSEAIVEIDVKKGTVARTIRTDQLGTHMVAVPPDGKRGYTTNGFSGTVTALDLGEGVKLKNQAVGKGPEGIAVSPDGKRVWVGNRADKTLTVLAADDLSVLKTLPAPGVPFRIAFTPDGKTVAVTEIGSGELSVFDAEKMTETKRIKVFGGKVEFDTPGPPPGPAAVVFSPNGKTAYCTMFFSKAVAVVDLSAGEVTGKITIEANEPDGIAYSPVGPAE